MTEKIIFLFFLLGLITIIMGGREENILALAINSNISNFYVRGFLKSIILAKTTKKKKKKNI